MPDIAVLRSELIALLEGGPGSGHFGHEGRPGEQGGSLPSGEGGGRPEGYVEWELTRGQLKKVERYGGATLPSDDYFKEQWMKRHHGKERGWGLGKRDWIVENMKFSEDYQRGLGQGWVDRARGLDYQRNEDINTFNLGYYRGFTDYFSNRKGWDAATRERFNSKYLSDVGEPPTPANYYGG